ncbi:acyl-CoA dehydrogenase [Nonomuraea jabiensis]|uniref:Acyl-CoA dehydrogenase n=2 Tax=Nonomuraea jabiensis TaxID=882448 RepID=A0A7W9G0N5_9ACTN|nr:acyl-CoA dehydrogenase [Nonomuraea jabiensis]
MAAIRASGLMGLLVPRAYGGMGLGLRELVDAAEILGGGCVSTAFMWAMHCQQVDAIARFGGAELRGDVLPAVARGEVYIASVTSQKGSGDLFSVAEAMVDLGDMVSFTRFAPVVTGGAYADGYLITLRRSESAPNGDVRLVYAHRRQVDFAVRGEWNALGMRGTRSAGAEIRGSVAHHQIIETAGGMRRVAMESLIPTSHLAWAACWLGTARTALAETTAKLRRQGAAATGQEATLLRIARARLTLELASSYVRTVCDYAADARSHGIPDGRLPDLQIHLNNVKVAAAEASYEVINQLIHAAGVATGYLQNSDIPLERHLRDLRAAGLNQPDDRLMSANGHLAFLDRRVLRPGMAG